MKKKYLLGSVLLVLIVSFALIVHAYYGLRSTEALLSFDAVVEGPFLAHPNLKELNNSNPYRAEALELVEFQIQHLMGTFQSASFQKEVGYQGVLGETAQHKVTFTNIEKSRKQGWKKFSYHFEAVVVFDKRIFGKSSYERAIRKIPIKLPLSPHLIYEQSVRGDFNPCTDEHYNSEGDFWYFWDPDQRDCPLRKDKNKVVRTHGQLQRLRSTQVSYPEFDQLYGDNGNADNMDISIFIGYIDDHTDIRDIKKKKRVKFRKKDEAYEAYDYIVRQLKLWDFQVTKKQDAFRVYRDGNKDGVHYFTKGENFLRRLEKRVVTELGNEINVRVQILLSDTAIDSHDFTFHYYAVPAMRDADIFVYDGHSGLGGTFDLTSEDFQAVRFDPHKYQIFFFNGCSTYPYFGGKFIRAKGGTQKLEVINSGLPTFAHTAIANSLAFLDYFLDGKTRTYQQILENLDKSNYSDDPEEAEFTYLMGVSGDEDNTWRPE